MNFFDLSVDENAIWAMFHYESEDFLSVAKVDVNNLTIYETWNLTMINHTTVANGFVVCGVLYVVCERLVACRSARLLRAFAGREHK